MIVTFIYKIKNSEKYYGKYIGQIRDNYEEGLDKEMLCKLSNILNILNIENIDDISIGIIGFNRDTYDYFSEDEAKIFDLLYCDWSNQEPEIYINGKKMKLS